MSQFVFKMPDLGEGTVEAEIVAWRTSPGALVTEDQIIADVMTDKAAVEVPAPVSGRVLSITGEAGDKVAVGSPLIVFELDDGAAAATGSPTGPAEPSVRVRTSPANRRRAREAGIDLESVTGSGPGGRIVRSDLAGIRPPAPTGAPERADAASVAAIPVAGSAAAMSTGAASAAVDGVTEIKVIGLRRLIAERMSEAKRTIPHFAYVEEVDVTELAALRQHLNAQAARDQPGLTYLPFVIMALVRALRDFPQCNARYDAGRGLLMQYRAVHVGVATQTPDGLKVPVVRHAQGLGLADLAAEIRRVADAARGNRATREELTGSTITVTSLGKLGGIVSTPVINAPEVVIIGLNKAVERPVVYQGAIAVRRIMNLSSSFDHRFVDGYDAAAMIQALKELLEHPAMIFYPR